MAVNPEKRFIVKEVVVTGVGVDGPTGPIGATGATLPSNTSDITHDGSERNGEALDALMDELLYIVLTGGTFAHGLGFQEKGFTVVNVPLTWVKNKATVVSQLITGSSIGTESAGTTATNYTLTGINITADGQWTLTINDGTTEVELTVDLLFYNKVHYGARVPGTINDAFILGLSGNDLLPTKVKEFTVTAGASDKIFWAQSQAYGIPTFTVLGFEGGFTLAGSISHQNASGHSETYDVWESDTINLGETTVDVT